jgi:hypothetical protein
MDRGITHTEDYKEVITMAPEAPGNLVVIDLRFQDGELKGSVERVEYEQEYTARIEEAGGWFYALWNEMPKGDDYVSLGGGVVYVKKDLPRGYRISPKEPIQLDSLGNDRYAYRYPALGEGLMLVLMLPKGYTLADYQPTPISAKVFKKGRLAVYWKPEAKYGTRVKITWAIKKVNGDLRAERDRINADIDISENVPDNIGVFVDIPARQSKDEVTHKRELLVVHMKRLERLEVQAAKYGMGADPRIEMEIDEIKEQIKNLKHEVEIRTGKN